MFVYSESMQGGMYIKLSGTIFKYYICFHDIKIKLNLFRFESIVKNSNLFDKFYIYKEINENKIHIYVSNRFTNKFKLHYKIILGE